MNSLNYISVSKLWGKRTFLIPFLLFSVSLCIYLFFFLTRNEKSDEHFSKFNWNHFEYPARGAEEQTTLFADLLRYK